MRKMTPTIVIILEADITAGKPLLQRAMLRGVDLRHLIFPHILDLSTYQKGTNNNSTTRTVPDRVTGTTDTGAVQAVHQVVDDHRVRKRGSAGSWPCMITTRLPCHPTLTLQKKNYPSMRGIISRCMEQKTQMVSTGEN
uniref:Uncharacterized protein n=1 Tax=Cacopsylla melanoneura TaxID=428564 RepID=A0A8D8SMH4_9HEMI